MHTKQATEAAENGCAGEGGRQHLHPVFLPEPLSYEKKTVIFHTLAKISIEYKFFVVAGSGSGKDTVCNRSLTVP